MTLDDVDCLGLIDLVLNCPVAFAVSRHKDHLLIALAERLGESVARANPCSGTHRRHFFGVSGIHGACMKADLSLRVLELQLLNAELFLAWGLNRDCLDLGWEIKLQRLLRVLLHSLHLQPLRRFRRWVSLQELAWTCLQVISRHLKFGLTLYVLLVNSDRELARDSHRAL